MMRKIVISQKLTKQTNLNYEKTNYEFRNYCEFWNFLLL